MQLFNFETYHDPVALDYEMLVIHWITSVVIFNTRYFDIKITSSADIKSVYW
jgi:hypothetical protein